MTKDKKGPGKGKVKRGPKSVIDHDLIHKLYDEGMTKIAIAKKVGCSTATVSTSTRRRKDAVIHENLPGVDKICWDTVKRAISVGCTRVDVAHLIKCDLLTLDIGSWKVYGISFTDFYDQQLVDLKKRLRAMQVRLALGLDSDGKEVNPPSEKMLIMLGRVICDQREDAELIPLIEDAIGRIQILEAKPSKKKKANTK